MEIVHTPTVRRATDSDVLTPEDIAAVLRAAGEGRRGGLGEHAADLVSGANALGINVDVVNVATGSSAEEGDEAVAETPP